jgi:hypothetical protein
MCPAILVAVVSHHTHQTHYHARAFRGMTRDFMQTDICYSKTLTYAIRRKKSLPLTKAVSPPPPVRWPVYKIRSCLTTCVVVRKTQLFVLRVNALSSIVVVRVLGADVKFCSTN